MKQLHEKQYLLLGRKSYTFEFEHQGKATPTKKDLKEQISKKLNVPIEKINIQHIYTSYGSNLSKVNVNVYEEEQTLKFLETPKGKKTPLKAK